MGLRLPNSYPNQIQCSDQSTFTFVRQLETEKPCASVSHVLEDTRLTSHTKKNTGGKRKNQYARGLSIIVLPLCLSLLMWKGFHFRFIRAILAILALMIQPNRVSFSVRKKRLAMSL